MELLISIAGYSILWAAVGVGRNKESKLNPKTFNWWLTLSLLVTGTLILKFYT